MPARKNTKTKNKLRFTPSRLVKTNGKFSKGKLSIIAVSLVAIGALLVRITSATQYYVSTSTVIANKWIRNASDCTVDYCIFPYPAPTYVWWGPYVPIYSPNPTGSGWKICFTMGLLSETGSYSAIVRTDFTHDNGVLFDGVEHDFYIANGQARAQDYCFATHIGPAVWQRVEIRAALLSSHNASLIIYHATLTAL